MIPTKLRLQGFLSYQEETLLDFSSLHVACISGMNGAGKSSILDAITWCLFGEARQRNDALINLNSESAEVELEFQYENNGYRVYRARKRTKNTQLEFFIKNESEWKDISERTIKATQDLITQTLNMDYETFINASFFLQGKSDQFARQTPGKRKEILTKILGLEKWETYKTQALQQRRELEQTKLLNDNRIEEKKDELDREEEYHQILATFEKEQKAIQSNLVQQESFLSILKEQKSQLEQIENQLKDKSINKERLLKSSDTLTNRIEEKNTQLDHNNATIDQKEQIESKYAKLQEKQLELNTLSEKQETFNKLKEENYSLQIELTKRKEKIVGEIKYLKDQQKNNDSNQKQIKVNKKEIETLEKQSFSQTLLVNQLENHKEQKQTLEEQITNNLAENKHLLTLMKELEDHIDQIKTLDAPTCPFCEQNLTPSHREKILSENHTKGKILGDQYRENSTTNKSITKKLNTIQEQILEAQKAQQFLAINNHKTDTLKQQNNKLTETLSENATQKISTLEESIANNSFAPKLKKQLELIDTQLTKLEYEPSKYQIIKKQAEELSTYQELNQNLQIALATQIEIQSSLSELITRKESETDQLAALENEMANLKSTLSNIVEDGQSTPIQERTTAISNEIKNLKQSSYDNQLSIGGAKQSINNLIMIQSQKESLEEQNKLILSQIASLKEIEKAFGREGIPALLIEQAIPEIENRANDILRKLTNDEMTISLITQEEYKDKKREDLKETMEIKIHDKFGSRDYEMFSGGETFRINFALRLALSELLSKRAGAKLQTLVIDEGFGSQDEYGRQKLTEVINPIKEEFALILVITHIESLKDAFPNRILVEKTAQGSIATVA